MRRRVLIVLIACGLLLPLSAQAQIAHGATAAADGGTTQLDMAFPAGITAGQMLTICIVNKYPTNSPTTPDGWTLPANGQGTGGSGASGVDSGNVYATVYVRVADGTESGSQVVDIPSGNAAVGVISRYTKTLATWSYAAVNGADNSVGTDWSVTAGADPGVTGGDMVVACSGVNGNVATWSSEAIAQTGITWGASNERRDQAGGDGDDTTLVFSDHAASSGTSSAAPVFTMTGSATSGSTPAGATVLMRLREVASPCTGGFLLFGVGKCE